MVRPRRFLTRTLRVALLALAAGSIACGGASDSGPGESLTVSGTVLGGDGVPLAQVSVIARPALEPEQIDSSRLSELDGLGLACIDERAPLACDDQRESTKTGAQGEFSMTFAMNQPVGGSRAVATVPKPMTVAVREDPGSGELSGPAITRQVAPDVATIDVGTLTMWEPVLELTTLESGDAVVHWEPAPLIQVTGYRVLVEGSDGRLVWQETTSELELELELKLANLDGTLGAVSVVALGKDAPQRWRSARIPYRADDGTVRLATVDEVGWPEHADLGPELVLAAIGALFLASLILVIVAGARHRWRLAMIPVLRPAPGRR